MRKDLLKKISTLIIICLVMIGISIVNVKAETLTSEDGMWEYEIRESGDVVIEKYFGNASEIVIPSQINGKNITSIEGELFIGNKDITSVKISEGIKEILFSAFKGCENLVSVEIPDTVEVIDNYAFWDTKWLEQKQAENPYVIVNGILIDARMVEGVAKIPEGVTSIGESAFEGNRELTGFEIPKSVTTIGNSAFVDCNGLTSVEIPDNITSIGTLAFARSSIASIKIPNSVTDIGAGAFNGCWNLSSIDIPFGVDIIKNYTFFNCTNLTSVKLPISVERFQNSVFEGCSSLTDIVLPPNLSSLENDTFENCSSLKSIRMMSSNIRINEDIISECENLTTIYGIKGSEAETYANDNGLEFIAIKELTYENSGVTVKSYSLPEDVQLVVDVTDEAKEENVLKAMDKLGYEYVAYDISLINQAGEDLKSDEMLTVTIKKPEKFNDGFHLYIYSVDDEGNAIEMDTVYEDGMLIFKTNNSGTYAVVDKTKRKDNNIIKENTEGNITKESVSNKDLTKDNATNDASNNNTIVIVISVILVFVVIVICLMIFLKKRKK